MLNPINKMTSITKSGKNQDGNVFDPTRNKANSVSQYAHQPFRICSNFKDMSISVNSPSNSHEISDDDSASQCHMSNNVKLLTSVHSEMENCTSFIKHPTEHTAENKFHCFYNSMYENEEVVKLKKTKEQRIVSTRGTVRGIKDKVRAGVVTMADTFDNQIKYRTLEEGKIVVYLTSLQVVRTTAIKCQALRRLLLTHMVIFDERDLYINIDYQRELDERINIAYNCKRKHILPQLFINGEHVGGIDEVESLNETGDLRAIFEPFPVGRQECKTTMRVPCQECGGHRYLPCTDCHGSKKSLHRNHFTEQFCSLRCVSCDESGLQRCKSCLDVK